MTDRIRIDGLLVHAVVGVHACERKAPREIRIDLVLETDLAKAGDSDDLADTVDYDAVANAVHARVASMQPRLIESVAAAAADVCLAVRAVAAVEVTVHKPGAIDCARSVSVTIRRGR